MIVLLCSLDTFYVLIIVGGIMLHTYCRQVFTNFTGDAGGSRVQSTSGTNSDIYIFHCVCKFIRLKWSSLFCWKNYVSSSPLTTRTLLFGLVNKERKLLIWYKYLNCRGVYHIFKRKLLTFPTWNNLSINIKCEILLKLFIFRLVKVFRLVTAFKTLLTCYPSHFCQCFW